MLRPCPRCGRPRQHGAGCGGCGWIPSSARPRPSRHTRGLGSDHDAIRRQVLAEETRCCYCHRPVDKQRDGRTDPQGPVAAHMLARALGGPNVRANYRLAHKLCNEKAGAA